LIGQFADVTVTEALRNSLRGRLVEPYTDVPVVTSLSA
jgi:hypothetical protein